MKKIILLIAVLIAAGLTNSQAQDTWTQKANFGGDARRGATGFSIGDKGYIGTGYKQTGEIYGIFLKDFWEYDSSNNTWTQKADFGGAARTGAVSFSIGGKGYIGTGGSVNMFGQNSVQYKDFWEYDPATNNWLQKADFGGAARTGATSFSINGKGYIGTGGSNDASGGNSMLYKDFWEYDTASNTWTQKADFGGVGRNFAASFTINGKGYIGTGGTGNPCSSGGNALKDFYEYNPANNTWMQKADFGGIVRYHATGFSIGSKGYMGTGNSCTIEEMGDMWEYTPASNSWTQNWDLGGPGRYWAVSFTINCKGYIATGGYFDSPGTYGAYNDFWEWQGGKCDESKLSITNVIPDNASLAESFVLWEGSIDDDPKPLKVCADGSHATNFKFTNNNASINSAYIGFRIKSDPNGYDTDQIGDFFVSNNDNVVSALYYHPTYVGESHKPKRTDTIEIYTPTDGVLFNIPLEIYRAPIVFVHGLMGNEGTFAPMETRLKIDSFYVEKLTTKVNYTYSTWKGFEENTSVVPDGINALLITCRAYGFSAGKVNLIGHSLGGIMSRLYLQGNYGVTYRNDVNEIITINTPHSGTQLADNVVGAENGVGCTIMKFIYSESEAACPTLLVDLSVDGFAIDDELNGPLLNAN
ncbi:MAG: hypothetical protein ABIO46_02705, partial [Chitinophagales bacterium]